MQRYQTIAEYMQSLRDDFAAAVRRANEDGLTQKERAARHAYASALNNVTNQMDDVWIGADLRTAKPLVDCQPSDMQP